MTPEQKAKTAAIFAAAAEGKAIEWNSNKNGWVAADPFSSESFYNVITFPDCYRVKPWQLPAPPAGQRWHRDDFTEADLPEGWRPLLEGEIRQQDDQYQLAGWMDVSQENKDESPWSPNEYSAKHRTRRPLPSAPVMVPWDSPEDVPGPVCWIRSMGNHERLVVCFFGSTTPKKGGVIDALGNWKDWDALFSWEHSTDRVTWKPCTKEKK